jgi:hypothetical protein
MDLPFNSAPKKIQGPPEPSARASSIPPSPSPSDAIVTNSNSIFKNCCGTSNCCKKVSVPEHRFKEENFLNGSLDLIPSTSLSLKIQSLLEV